MSTTGVLWGEHLGSTKHMSDVATVQRSIGAYITARVRETIREQALMLITGDVGTGKTFATARAAETVAAESGAEVVWVEFVGDVRGRALLRTLTRQITGETAPASATQDDLAHALAASLSAHPRLVVLDESQHVTAQAMLVLRWLGDRPGSQMSLVVVGTPKLRAKVPPEMLSRAVADITVEHLSDTDVVPTLHAYHPIFRTAADVDLVWVNRTRAAGEFRWWAKALVKAVDYVAVSNGLLTRDTLDKVSADLSNGQS